MLDAYFSFQEHLLILLLPFSDFDKQKDSVSELIADDWSVKFNMVFSPSKNPEMMKHYEKLRLLKERYRNKYAHGGFEKKYGSLYAKIDGIGFIPVRMSLSNSFSLVPIDNITFSEICSVINEFEDYLFLSKDWSRAIKLIQSGLDIYFDDAQIKEYKEMIKSGDKLKKFIEYEFEMVDRNSEIVCIISITIK